MKRCATCIGGYSCEALNGSCLPPTPYYQDEYVTLYHGDAGGVLPSISGVDLLLTDPPYPGLTGGYRRSFPGVAAPRGAQRLSQNVLDLGGAA